MRERLIELIGKCCAKNLNMVQLLEFEKLILADYLLENGVVVLPCVAMVEQFIKDGRFDRRRTSHNGRMAVVYIDKEKWNKPLIDITELFYDDEKALERIQALKEGAE